MSKVKESPDKNGNGKHGNGHNKAEGHSNAEASSSSDMAISKKSPVRKKQTVTAKLKENKPNSDKLGSFSVRDLESLSPQQRWHLKKRLEALNGNKKTSKGDKVKPTGNGKRGRPAIGDGLTPQKRWHMKKKEEKLAIQKKTGEPAPKRGRPAAPIKSAADLTRQKRWHLKQKLEKLEKMKKKGVISKEVKGEIRDIRALLDESYKTAKTVKADKAKRISNKDLVSMSPQKRWYHKNKADLAKARKTTKKPATKIHKVSAKVASGKRISNSELKGSVTKAKTKTKSKAKTSARLSNKQLKNMSKLDNVLS